MEQLFDSLRLRNKTLNGNPKARTLRRSAFSPQLPRSSTYNYTSHFLPNMKPLQTLPTLFGVYKSPKNPGHLNL